MRSKNVKIQPPTTFGENCMVVLRTENWSVGNKSQVNKPIYFFKLAFVNKVL